MKSTDNKTLPNTTSKSYTTTINRCKVVLNFATDNDKKAIETAKSILLSTYYQDASPISEKNRD